MKDAWTEVPSLRAMRRSESDLNLDAIDADECEREEGRTDYLAVMSEHLHKNGPAAEATAPGHDHNAERGA